MGGGSGVGVQTGVGGWEATCDPCCQFQTTSECQKCNGTESHCAGMSE